MEINRIIELIEKSKNGDLYFIRKMTDGYKSYKPRTSDTLIEKITDMILHYLKFFSEKEQIVFNPMGYRDETIEKYKVKDIEDYKSLIESFEYPKIEGLEKEIDNLKSYCISYDVIDNNQNEKILLLRRINKLKKLRNNGFLIHFRGEELVDIDDEVFGIDNEIDLIIYKDEILILNHIALERIFDLTIQYKNKAKETLKILRDKVRISNFDKFEEDCLNDSRYKKALTKMLNEKELIEKSFDNPRNLIEIIDTFDLQIEYELYPEFILVYEYKNQIMDFLRIIRDSYYISINQNRPGCDEKI